MRDPRIPGVPEPLAGTPAPSAPVAAAGSVPAPADADSEALSAEEPECEVVDLDVDALAAKAAQADEYLEMARRTRAEFENYRKRTAREAAAAQERGAVKLALALLPAIDNLDRALAHVDESAENGDGTLVAGIRHVQADLLAALKHAEIEPYSPEGEPFDPQYHEAVAQQPFEGAEPGTVVEVYQRGYRRGENVLRPARVVVAG